MKLIYFLTLLVTLTGLLIPGGNWAKEGDQTSSPFPLLLRDNMGKEQKLKSWKWTQGARPLTWLLEETRKTPSPEVPLALEFREENSTAFVNGVITLIPLDRIRALDYNAENDSVSVQVTTSKPDHNETLKGWTKYRGINKIAIDAEVDKGDLGLAEVKFLGGVSKGIKGMKFPNPVLGPPLVGRAATVTVLDKDQKTEIPVHDLRVLYRFIHGGEKLISLLHFKKTLKVDVAQIKKINRADNEEGSDLIWQVTTGNADETLTLLQMVTIDEKDAQLVGLLGKVSVGYKLFPPHVIGGIEFGSPMDK